MKTMEYETRAKFWIAHFFFSVKGRNGELNKNYPTMHFSSVFGQF